MVGTKTNERPGTRARASYVRSSAYKAREVLDLIRGKGCADAQDILAFSERDVAQPIAKVLDSALANAEHNRRPGRRDELYVSACYADEGPTLEALAPPGPGEGHPHPQAHLPRHRDRQPLRPPRRSSEMQALQSQRGVAAAEARRRRVARSRAAAPEEVEAEGSDAEVDVEAQASRGGSGHRKPPWPTTRPPISTRARTSTSRHPRTPATTSRHPRTPSPKTVAPEPATKSPASQQGGN